MRVYEGGAAVTLTKRDFVATGGEGSIYVKGNTAYKLYLDPSKMISQGKIQELGALTAPYIIKPKQVLTGPKGNLIGYSMSAVPSSYALCQLFPRVFRDRNHLSHQKVLELIQRMQTGVEHAHSKQVLIVDLNEMNFLVAKDFGEIFFIDVDSYQTPHFPATALMESVRDRQVQNNDFTAGSDWFSFAVVSFQMFVGIHPYKGKHPSLKGLEARMSSNVSVLNSSVRVPKVCYPFGVVPQAYLDWYTAVFEQGQRVAPPGGPQRSILLTPTVKTLRGDANLSIDELYSYDGTILETWPHEGRLVVVTNKGVWIDQRRIKDITTKIGAVGFSPRRGFAVSLSEDAGVPSVENLTEGGTPLPFGLTVDATMTYGGRIYVKNEDKILELLLNEVGNNLVISTRLAAQVLPKATQLFPGAVFQDLLGSIYVSVFPKEGLTRQVELPQLEGYRVVEAKYDSGVLVVIGTRKGRYDRLVFRFDEPHQEYDLRVVKNIPYIGINFTVLDSGVVVLLNEEEKLELFSREKGSKGLKFVEDASLGGDITLGRLGAQLLFIRDHQVYKVSMK